MARRPWYADQWVGYQRAWLRADVLAGVTVTAYLIPQVMAYAELAGLPAAVGPWAAVGALGCYALVGSSRRLSVGPESTTALMTAAALGSAAQAGVDPAALAAALALAVGIICVAAAMIGMSRFADLLSRPVLVGYMLGIAVAMVVSQLGKVTRVPTEGDSVGAELASFVGHVDQVHVPTLALGAATTVFLLACSARFPRAPTALLGMAGAAAVVALLDLEEAGIRLVGRFDTAAPDPGLPDLALGDVGGLVVPALGIALVGFTDNVLTARAFADVQQGERVVPQRELIGMGLANLGSGLLHGFPVSSSGSRTAIVAAVGARSQVASVASLVTTVLAVLVLAPLLAAFPSAALGSVVVYAATRLVQVGELRRIARFRRSELVIALVTCMAVIAVGVLYGVLIAIGLSIADLLRRVVRPHDAVLGAVPGLAGLHDVDDYPGAEQVPGLLIYRYDSPLFFANADDFLTRARAAVDEASELRWFVLNAEAVVDVDLTAVDALETLRRDLAQRGVVMGLARMKQDLRDTLAPTGLLDRIGEDRLFPTLPTAIAGYRAATGA